MVRRGELAPPQLSAAKSEQALTYWNGRSFDIPRPFENLRARDTGLRIRMDSRPLSLLKGSQHSFRKVVPYQFLDGSGGEMAAEGGRLTQGDTQALFDGCSISARVAVPFG